LENIGDVPYHLLTDTRHALALEQNAKEVGFLTCIFEDQPPFRFQAEASDCFARVSMWVINSASPSSNTSINN
jgi:hypothetical protein